MLALAGWVVSGWSAGSRSYDGSRIRIAEVKRGDLVRDISADGKVITANSPVLYAIAGGTVSLKVVAGDVVEKGQVLAVIDSPELHSKLVQEESTLASMEAEASRAQLDARIASLNARKARDQALIDHTAAQRDLERYERANKAREGKFEAADGGTLFLDEIGNLPAAGQMKLLRVLETGRFARLGSNRERQVRVRVVSATNADLPAMIREGGFREDLYYRLNTIELSMPPLGERPGDVLPLAEHFGAGGKPLSPAAVAALQRHSWPGNVRELRNVIQRAQLLATGPRIEPDDLALPRAQATRPGPAREPEREQIEAALQRAGGVIAQAAAELGMSRQALYRRMERHGLKSP